MPRKRNEVVPAKEVEIVPDGFYQGMAYDEVISALCDDMERPLIEKEVALEAVMPTIDMMLARSLQVVQHGLGERYAKEAAIKICQTALPFALTEVEPPKTYAAIAGAGRVVRKG